MSRASSWKTVEVVRPQPGQAATIGTNERSPMVCSSLLRDLEPRVVRSPPGSGVSEKRMVSPMPCCRRMPMAADEATMPLDAHAGLGQAQMQRVIRSGSASRV